MEGLDHLAISAFRNVTATEDRWNRQLTPLPPPGAAGNRWARIAQVFAPPALISKNVFIY